MLSIVIKLKIIKLKVNYASAKKNCLYSINNSNYVYRYYRHHNMRNYYETKYCLGFRRSYIEIKKNIPINNRFEILFILMFISIIILKNIRSLVNYILTKVDY